MAWTVRLWLTCLWVALHASYAARASSVERLDASGTFDGCVPLGPLADAANLTAAERAILPDLCIPYGVDFREISRPILHNGIPDGVDCEPAQWCDSEALCTTVCKTGTVVVDPWLKWASRWQRRVASEVPLCYSCIVGSHNSAITIANGYGNEDLYWQSFLKYIPKMASDKLVTSNQWLSVTDQLNLGVRLLELDVHWVAGELRIGHCGGLHSPALNFLLEALNTLSKLAGQHLRWDTETIGCSPSLSSLPTKDQRLLSDMLLEIAQWLGAPENADEFLVLYLDNEMDLKHWGKVGLLINMFLGAFPVDWIFTPNEKAIMFPGAWPSIQHLLKIGKRVMIASRRDYGPIMHSHLFFVNTTCGWTEPRLSETSPSPTCAYYETRQESQHGVFYRIGDCKLVYGPLNCNFALPSTTDLLDLLTDQAIVTATQCAWNSVSPDQVTPAAMMNTIWSWAPGHPIAMADKSSQITHEATAVPEGGCVAMSASDGRWRVTNCSASIPTACRTVADAASQHAPAEWRLGKPFTVPPAPAAAISRRGLLWSLLQALGSAARQALARARGFVHCENSLGKAAGGAGTPTLVCDQCCPLGFEFSYPRTGKENSALTSLLQSGGVEGCTLGLATSGLVTR